jgi:hypothetical protein
VLSCAEPEGERITHLIPTYPAHVESRDTTPHFHYLLTSLPIATMDLNLPNPRDELVAKRAVRQVHTLPIAIVKDEQEIQKRRAHACRKPNWAWAANSGHFDWMDWHTPASR